MPTGRNTPTQLNSTHGWTYQGLWLPSHTDTAGHTKAFDYPVTKTRLDIPRPLITQSHRHGWTYQCLWLPSHTDTAGHTKAFDYPVTQTRLDIPRPLITQSHRHGWTYQGLWLPSHWSLGGKSKCSGTRQIRTADHSRVTVDHANHQTTTTACPVYLSGSLVVWCVVWWETDWLSRSSDN